MDYTTIERRSAVKLYTTITLRQGVHCPLERAVDHRANPALKMTLPARELRTAGRSGAGGKKGENGVPPEGV